MKNIFNITTEYLSILDELEENGGEITTEIENQLAINESEIKQKSTSYVAVIKTLEASNKTIDDEIKRLQAIKKTRVNLVSNLKERLSTALKMFEITELKNDLFSIKFRKSESVVIDSINDLPDSCKIIKVEAISKTDIKRMIKSGSIISGARIETNLNMQIK